MSAEIQPHKKRGLLIALVAGVFALVALVAAALLVNIVEKFGLKGVTKPAADLAAILGPAAVAKA